MNMTQIEHGNPHDTDQMFDAGRRVERVWNVSLEDSFQLILKAMCRSSKEELCGFIDTGYGLHTVDNVHNEKTHNFLMDQDSFVATMDKIYSSDVGVLGVWHTHPNNVVWPTPRDLAGWPNPDLKWRYWIVTNSEVIEWKLR